MAIQGIEWHEQCLINQKSYLERLQKELDLYTNRVLDLKKKITERQLQIDRARKEGKNAFDSDKYNPYGGRK